MSYTVNVTRPMELDLEQAANVLAQVVMEDFESICDDIRILRGKTNLQSYEVEDLKRDLDVRDAMITILSYYMIPSEHREWLEIQRVYGNV